MQKKQKKILKKNKKAIIIKTKKQIINNELTFKKSKDKHSNVLENFFSKQSKNQETVKKQQNIEFPKKHGLKDQSTKNKKTKSLKVFLLIVAIILGIAASYLFRNIYVYIVSAIVVVYLILIFFLKRKPKLKTQEPIKEKSKEENIIITYRTEFDNFYEFIKLKKKVTTTEIAKNFKMSKKQVEGWGQILEQHGLIKINYPLFGDQEFEYV